MKLNKRFFTLLVSILMVIAVPFIIYGFNLNSVIFDKDLYKKEFSKYNVYMNLENYNIEEINNDVLDYFRNENDLIQNNFFNEREKTHLLDVKILIGKIFTIYYFSIILFIVLFIALIFLTNFNFKIIFKKFLIILLIGSFLTLLDAALFFLLSNFNFEFVFDVFHESLFNFGTYTFDPAIENIVVLYPQGLFFDFLIKIVINTILSSIIILFLSLLVIFIIFRQNFLKFLQKIPTGKRINRKL